MHVPSAVMGIVLHPVVAAVFQSFLRGNVRDTPD